MAIKSADTLGILQTPMPTARQMVAIGVCAAVVAVSIGILLAFCPDAEDVIISTLQVIHETQPFSGQILRVLIVGNLVFDELNKANKKDSEDKYDNEKKSIAKHRWQAFGALIIGVGLLALSEHYMHMEFDHKNLGSGAFNFLVFVSSCIGAGKAFAFTAAQLTKTKEKIKVQEMEPLSHKN